MHDMLPWYLIAVFFTWLAELVKENTFIFTIAFA
jgi:hypothetical protein